MADFLEYPEQNSYQHNMSLIKEQIIREAAKAYPNECGGFIVLINEGFELYPCKNISDNPIKNFVANPLEVLDALKRGACAIYHSHPDSDEPLSVKDIDTSEEFCIPVITCMVNQNKISIHTPSTCNSTIDWEKVLGLNE